MEWRRRSSGLILPRHRGGVCSILGVTQLSGFGIGGSDVPADPGAGQPLWSTTDKGSGISVTNSDLTASTGARNSVRSTVGIHQSWPRYVELSALNNAGNSAWRYGVATDDLPVASVALGDDANGIAFRGNDGGIMFNDGVIATSPLGEPTIVVQLATVDGRFWVGENNTWDGDPAARTGGYAIGVAADEYLYLCFGHDATSGSRSATLAVLGSYAHSPPAGFFAGW